MICKKCGNNLDFDSAVLEKFVACPFCGTFFPKELPSIESGTIEAELKKLADDFGGLEIYNPWSVIQYIYKNCQADAYWVNTSGNSLIGEALQSLDEKDRESLPSLLTGGEVEKQIDTNLIYSEIYSDESAAFCDKQTHVKVDSN